MSKKLNPNLYDSIIKAMFRGIDNNNENEELNWEIKKDFLDFYKKYCNTKSELKPEDIEPFNLLEKKIFSDSQNDLAYLTKDDRLIVLFEHQATYNPNMPSRLFDYYSKLLNKFWKERNIDLTSSKRWEPPVPELYVIEVFSTEKDRREKAENDKNTYSVRIDSMFDPKGLVNRELIRFDATVLHFDTEEIYEQYLNGKKPEDLIHEFSLYYSMIHHRYIELLTNDKKFQSLVLERQKLMEEEKDEKKKMEKKKKLISEMTKIRKKMKGIAVEDIIEIFQKENMFTEIFERMGEENMADITIKNDQEQNIEEVYADFVFTILNERKQAEKAKEEIEKAKEETEKAKEELKKQKEEKEKMKAMLFEIFGTDDLEEIKKISQVERKQL